MRTKAWLAVWLAVLVAGSGCGRDAARMRAAEDLQRASLAAKEKATVVVVAEAKEKAAAVVVAEAKGADVLLSDDFKGKLGLKWEIVNPDPSHYSLTKKPGGLTITTQAGGFAQGATDYKNVFLVDCPQAPGKDLQVTICVSDFKPKGDWNQMGLTFWNDQDNYIKWDCEWSGKPTLMTVVEVDSKWPLQQAYNPPADTGKLWLRAIKHGNRYALEASADGKSFVRYGQHEWGDGSVKKVGFFAKNGPGSTAPEVDATFEQFEVRAIPPAVGP